MTYTDLILGKGFGNGRGKFGQAKPRGHIGRIFAALGADLLDAVLRLLKPHQRGESLRLVQWMHIAALEVLDLSLVR